MPKSSEKQERRVYQASAIESLWYASDLAAQRASLVAKGPPPSPGGARTTGTIVRLLIGQTYGFIRLRDRREVFFHRADVEEDTPFNSLQIGERVSFELIVDAVSGLRAVRVTRRVPTA